MEENDRKKCPSCDGQGKIKVRFKNKAEAYFKCGMCHGRGTV